MSKILTIPLNRSADPNDLPLIGLQEFLLVGQSVDTVLLRALPGSPGRSAGAAGNYSVLQRTAAIADAWRGIRSIATGWGRAGNPPQLLEVCRVSRTPFARPRQAESTEGRKLRHPMSVKQLAQGVKYGRKITFRFVNGDPITGYLAGMDEDYYLILEPEEGMQFRRSLVARVGCLAIEIHTESTYEGEEGRGEMELIIGPFRGFVANRILGNGDSDSDARKAS